MHSTDASTFVTQNKQTEKPKAVISVLVWEPCLLALFLNNLWEKLDAFSKREGRVNWNPLSDGNKKKKKHPCHPAISSADQVEFLHSSSALQKQVT